MKKELISTPYAPKAVGPYSQAIRVGQFVYLSGQVALDPETGSLVGTDVVAQTEQVMKNIKAVLATQNLTFASVIKSTCFLKNMGDFQAFNETYARHFSVPYPARSTVEVARLPKDALVEVEVIALAEA